MPTYPFITVDVFTEHRFSGNPLAVFPDAGGLSEADMQSLAREFNLSETTFVLPPEDPAHTARIRIFTTSSELPFAGHPNVGSGYVLAQQGRDRAGVLLFEEPAGLVEVRVERDAVGAVIGTTIDAPQSLSLGSTLPVEAIAACAGLQPADIVLSTHAPVQASVGNGFVLAEVGREALSQAAPDGASFRETVGAFPALGGRLDLYLYAHDDEHVRTRMFAPLSGIQEDPATGSAATPLAALLLSFSDQSHRSYDIVQGVEMGRRSLLRAAARRTRDGIRASVGGHCVPVLRGEATI